LLGRFCNKNRMRDYKAMQHELADAGFTDIPRAACGDSGDRMFDAIETPDRWTNCLGVQCLRPLCPL